MGRLGLQAKGFFIQGEHDDIQNWTEDREGSSLLNSDTPSGRPDLHPWLHDRRDAFTRLLAEYSGEGLANAERAAARDRPDGATGRCPHERAVTPRYASIPVRVERSVRTMPVIHESGPLPDGHPLHNGFIFFGRKPPSSFKSPLPEFPQPDLSEGEIARLRKLLVETVKLKPLFTSKPAVGPRWGCRMSRSAVRARDPCGLGS